MMNNIAGLICFCIGMFFNLAGCLGLIRFPDIYNRLQAGTKCVTFGTIFILLGALVSSGFSATGMKAILCLIFILITSPTAAHAIAKGAHMSGVKLWKKSVVDKYKEDTKDQE